MRHLLSRRQRGVLERFAGSRTLLALDFDGTLAPIVSDPAKASMRAATRRLLHRAARAYPCVVLTGRSRADALRRLRGVPVAEVIGNHGLEGRRPRAAERRLVRGWIPVLEERLAGVPGVVLEDKGLSVAAHYRLSPRRAQARARVLEAASRLAGARVIGGKKVVNLLPAGGADKGRALVRARVRLGCDSAIYVGDDVTDEDVFALADPGRLLSVRVGRSARSAARYYIRSQDEIDLVLDALVALKPAGRGNPSTRRRRPVAAGSVSPSTWRGRPAAGAGRAGGRRAARPSWYKTVT